MYQKVIILILCFFVINNEENELKKSDIIGSWYPYIDTRIEVEEMTYREQYFNDNEFYFYQPILSMPYHYFINESKMYWLGLSKKDTLIIEKPVLIDKNTLKIVVKKPEYIILKRVIDINTLEDFVNQKIDEKTYYPSFLKREEYWKKYGVLPEDGNFESPPKCGNVP